MPNPSIERTCSGLRPPQAAHVKRWAHSNSGPLRRMKTNPPPAFCVEVAAAVALGCPSAGGQRTLSASATVIDCQHLPRLSIHRTAAPLRPAVGTRRFRTVAKGARSAGGVPNPAIKRTCLRQAAYGER